MTWRIRILKVYFETIEKNKENKIELYAFIEDVNHC